MVITDVVFSSCKKNLKDDKSGELARNEREVEEEIARDRYCSHYRFLCCVALSHNKPKESSCPQPASLGEHTKESNDNNGNMVQKRSSTGFRLTMQAY
jgi:hypothetical protein